MSAMDFQSPEALQDPLQLSPFWRCNILHLTLQLSAITLCNKYADPKGFTDETIEKIRLSLKELETRQAVDASLAIDKRPKLELWQQYFENGEYLRAAEISEEQNYNMIDGTMNNRSPKRSVLERLQEKQTKVNHLSPQRQSPELIQEIEAERNRK